ncbi:MAG: 3-oxoacyl-[acyl-carrier-protein] reductase [Chloroflexota bacterium]|nr:3-oxoacyl-[acyl-carrier-protein] reductase [Chloroflexota bacterium]
MSLKEQVALVTGGSRGIGRAISLRLARDGARIAIGDIREEEGKRTVAEVEALGVEALFVSLDVTQQESAAAAAKQVVERWGRLDILVNNAGITRDKLLLRMTPQDWDAVLNVNLKGAYLCSQAVLQPMLKRRRGRIVSIASVVGIAGNAGQTNYSASKAGIIGFTKSLAREVASRSITVNAVAPGFINTEMVQTLSQEIQKQVLERIPLARFGTPEDVAGVVAFLCSEEASYITGHVINVDGGLIM